MLRRRPFQKSLALFAYLPLSLALAAACSSDGDDTGSPPDVALGGQAGEGSSSGGTDSGSGGQDATGGKDAGSGGKASGGSGSGGLGGAGGDGPEPGPDGDGDGIPDASDTCPEVSNEGQEDGDDDGAGDACDVDVDNDGLIEVSTFEQLDWMRNSVDGRLRSDGTLLGGADGELQGDDTGCLNGLCNGYELTRDFDFDTNGNGEADAGDAFFDPEGDGKNLGWLPIRLSATFEGNGHHIKNLYINRGDINHESSTSVGFFAELNARKRDLAVRNVTFDGPLTQVAGASYVGVVAGRILVDPGQKAVFTNVHVVGELSASSVRVGGLVGHMYTPNTGLDDGGTLRIEGSSFQGMVTGTDLTGGLVGHVQITKRGHLFVERSFVKADVLSTSSEATDGTGGLIGRLETYEETSNGEHSEASLTRSYAFGSVESKGGCAGGLIGSVEAVYGPVTLKQAFTTSTVKAASTAAGMVACVRSSGVSLIPEVSENLVLGKVMSGTAEAGAIVASVVGAPVHGGQNHWASDTTGLSTATPSGDLDGSFGVTLSDLSCPTAPDDTSCVDTKTLFENWSSEVWSFGSASQLPGLVIDGVVHRPTYDAGTSKFTVTTTSLP